MMLSLFRKSTASEPVYAVYRAIVAQSRQPKFYADWSVPDTVTGRFDMISLFFKDMDRSLREMGAGDLAVPKKIQKMGNIFFGLLAALNEAMDRKDLTALDAVLSRNVFDGATGPNVRSLAEYLLAEDAHLMTQSADTIVGGAIAFEAAA
jgi:cytochrome b pre-mRNA-processing protein 3